MPDLGFSGVNVLGLNIGGSVLPNQGLSQAQAFVIEEVTGSKRAIYMRGRALPYRGVEWEGTMRRKRTYYAGQPTGSMQILGPQEEPTTIEGIWKDRFIPSSQTSVFQNEATRYVSRALDLVQIFNDFRISGNRLRVQWGPFIRFGYLVRFKTSVDNERDIKWEAEFDWIAQDSGEIVPLASSRTPPVPTLRAMMNGIDDALAQTPLQVVRQFKDRIFTAIKGIRNKTGVIFEQVRLVQDVVSTPSQVLGAIGAATESIKYEGEAAISQLVNTPRTTIQATDRITDVLRVEIWRRNTAYSTFGLQATSIKREREIRQRARPGSLAVITVPGDITLRQLSLEAYGTADSWQLIADVNRIKTSIVPAGTVIIIPPPRSTQAVNTRGALTS